MSDRRRRVVEGALAAWIIAASVAYLYQFTPYITPILRLLGDG